MSFYYKLRPIADNINQENPIEGLVAMAVSIGTIGLDDLARSIAERSTFTRPEIKGIMEAMVDEVERYLSLGENVTLGDLGTFSVSAKSRIVERPDEIRGTSIKLKRIVHRPSQAMTKRLKYVSWERVAWEKSV